ncbi:MAG TPA: Sec-independent protein translocase protein TatB [Casimicrobiaceae bacterium]|nr:Sec-independent protein translocase protein TatB [Casimicrobiaceae bacterium]
MFDIGFSEIVVIGVVALVVIGPERLPKTARTIGLLFGRLQRYVNEVKADISREMELDELRRLKGEMQGAAREIEQSMRTAASDFHAGVRNVESELNAAASEASKSASAEATAAPSPPAPAVEAPRQAALPGFDKI